MTAPKIERPYIGPGLLKNKTDGLISLSDLADELNVPETRLRPFVEHGYLAVYADHPDPKLCIVGRPKQAALDWLRGCMAPMKMVPMMPVGYACEIMGMDLRNFRRYVLEYGVPLLFDPIFGNLISILQFHKMHVRFFPYHKRTRFDRQMLFSIMAGIDTGDADQIKKPLNYDVQVEREIRRIAKMSEPERTLRAADLVEAYQDAKVVYSVVKKLTDNRRNNKIANRVDRLMEEQIVKMEKQAGGQSSSSASPISSAIDSASPSTTNPSIED